MRKERTKTLVAMAIILGSLAFIYFAMVPRPPSVEGRPFEGIGQIAAEQAQRLVGNGGQIMLILRDTSVFKNPATDFQSEAFFQTLRKYKLSVSITNLVKEDPLRIMRVPRGDYVELLRKGTDKDVIVSLMGPPILTDLDKSKLKEKGPRVVAVCTGSIPQQVNLRDLFAQGLLHAAILSRPNPETKPPKINKLQAWFDNYYLLITEANLNDLPQQNEKAGF